MARATSFVALSKLWIYIEKNMRFTFWMITIDMEHRCIYHLACVRAVEWRSGIWGRGSVTDARKLVLMMSNLLEMINGSLIAESLMSDKDRRLHLEHTRRPDGQCPHLWNEADHLGLFGSTQKACISRWLTQTQTFHNHTLTCKAGISMYLNTQDFVAELTVFRWRFQKRILLRPRLSKSNRIDGLWKHTWVNLSRVLLNTNRGGMGSVAEKPSSHLYYLCMITSAMQLSQTQDTMKK